MQWKYRSAMTRGSRKFERMTSTLQFILGRYPVKKRHNKSVLKKARSAVEVSDRDFHYI
jgi:hypothetical protein